jgi:NDP-sugar pyrophosphorylase family protein
MGGKGERFKQAGYATPKPFIPVDGVPMFVRVLQNIYSGTIADIYLVLHEKFMEAAQQATESFPFSSQIRFVPLNRQTRGSAETLLALRDILPPQDPIFTINCDQLIAGGLDRSIHQFLVSDSDVMIPFFRPTDGAYLKLRAEGERVCEMGRDLSGTALAAAGIYYFRSFELLSPYLSETLRDAEDLNEPCITQSLKLMLFSDLSIVTYDLGSSFTPLGTPEDIHAFNATC